MGRYTGSWLLKFLAINAVVLLAACAGDGGTTTVDDVPAPEDTVDAAEEVSLDTVDVVAPPPDTDRDTDADIEPTCPPEIDPCVACDVDDDCEDVFDDLGICEVATCDAELRYCIIEPAEEGTPCSDEDPCNGLEACAVVDEEGACVAGLPLKCDDGDPCNGMESCEAGVGCTDGEPLDCDDADVCNGGETCEVGVGCAEGTPLVCDDEEPCNGKEGCDPATGCTEGFALNCDDGDPCNGEETCETGVGCAEGTPLDCDDANTCTDDSCDPASGCVHLPNDQPGCCEEDGDCDDGNPCTTDVCESDTQACTHVPAEGPCEDGDPCTIDDLCGGAECISGDALPDCALICEISGSVGEVVECDIGLARRSANDEAPAVAHFHVLYPGEMATLATFIDQICLGPTNCLSVNIPGAGTSLGENGHTVYIFPEEPAAWDGDCGLSIEHVVDSSAPLSQAWYDDLENIQGDAHLLGLSFILTQDIPVATPVLAYDIGASSVTKVPLSVATVDGTIVTSDQSCGASLVHCFDGMPCTEDVCDAGEASCTFPLQEGECDDGNQCTEGDHCDALGDCVPSNPTFEGTECYGEDLCVEIGTCDGGGICAMDPDLEVTCPEPPSDCATWQCDSVTGGCALLAFAPGIGCSDEDPCTMDDACDGNGICVGTPTVCDDGLDCTVDSCDPDDGSCINLPDSASCDDSNVCTDDVCDPGVGCVLTPAAGDCDDQDVCTLDDACDAGICAGAWDPVGCGCTLYEDCAPLDDGDPCTGTWACVFGACEINPSTVVDCPAYAGDCQVWACDPDSGDCVATDAESGTACDGGPCLDGAACDAGGQCLGVSVDCDDGDECTVDSCDPDDGCVNEADLECGSTFCICEVSGLAGATVDCPLTVVRASEAGEGPTGADFELSWDSASMSLAGFEDDLCYGTICMPKTVPNCSGEGTGCVWGSLYPTGHSIVAVPTDLVDWSENGTLLFFHPTDSFKQLTDAWMGDDGISGEGQFLLARVTLVEDIDAASPACVYMSDPAFSLPSGLDLDVTVQDVDGARVIVVD